MSLDIHPYFFWANQKQQILQQQNLIHTLTHTHTHPAVLSESLDTMGRRLLDTFPRDDLPEIYIHYIIRLNQ
jgi:hypothetical protein